MTGITTTTTMRPILFKLNQAADICCLKPQGLRNWVALGVITPAVRGSQAVSHRFSAQQCLGLAVVAGLVNSPTGCSNAHAKAMIEQWGAMSEIQLDHWLSTWRPKLADERTEEEFVSWGSSPVFTGVERPKPPEWDVTREDILQRLERVDTAILKRMGLEGGRGSQARMSE